MFFGFFGRNRFGLVELEKWIDLWDTLYVWDTLLLHIAIYYILHYKICVDGMVLEV